MRAHQLISAQWVLWLGAAKISTTRLIEARKTPALGNAPLQWWFQSSSPSGSSNKRNRRSRSPEYAAQAPLGLPMS
jgi:hypothetical protein